MHCGHCGWHSCCWESGAHFLPMYAQPPMRDPRYVRRPTRSEEKGLLRARLEDLREEIADIERRLAAVEE